jgi:hypothetical protein
MKVTDDVVYSFREAMTNVAGHRIADLFGANDIEELLNAVLDIVQTAPETEETPLFYRVVLKNTKGVIHVQDCDFQPTEDDYDGEVLSVTPLYAHSQPKRKPLSDEVLTKLWVRSPVLGCTKHEFIMLSQVIEKAHGIGVE